MMAKLQLIAAIMAALSAIVVEARVDTILERMVDRMFDALEEGFSDASEEGLWQVHGKKASEAYLFAAKYLEENEEKEHLVHIYDLMTAWKQIANYPHWCDKKSLKYIATIAEYEPKRWHKTRSLIDATRTNAAECLTPGYIADRLKPHRFLLRVYNNKEVKFIDDRFIDDYWSENKDDRNSEFTNFTSIGGLKASKAIAKAIRRDSDNGIKDPNNRKQVRAYLEKRLYKPCNDYWHAFSDVTLQIYRASEFWEGGYDKLISSLDDESKKLFFRFHLCKHRELFWDKPKSKETFEKVMSELASLTESKS